MKDPRVTACVPCYNQAHNLSSVIGSLRGQTRSCAEILVVDDGSADGTFLAAKSLADRVIKHSQNLGRGAVRARAVAEAKTEYLMFCDAGVLLPQDFVERSMSYMDSPKVAAVFGLVAPETIGGSVQRWRSRHLFKVDKHREAARNASLMTGCALLRLRAIKAVGGFKTNLRAGEDAEIGTRLLENGFEVVLDPALRGTALNNDSLLQLLNRYTRWNTSPNRPPAFTEYVRTISYALKVMVKEDLSKGDLPCALISLIVPHYQFWAARMRSQPC